MNRDEYLQIVTGPPKRWEQVRAWRAEGLTYKQIAGILGVSRQRVHQIGQAPKPPKIKKQRVRQSKKESQRIIDQQVTDWHKKLTERKNRVNK